MATNLKNESTEFFMESHDKSELNELEGFVDWKGRPARKDRHGGQRAVLFIYVMTLMNNLAYIGMAINLVIYFIMFMHIEIAVAANMLTDFMGTTFLLALVVGIFSDSFLNRFKTTVLSACLQLAGYLILLIQAHYGSLKPPPCSPFNPFSVCEKVSGVKIAILYVGLYAIAIGNGGTGSVVAPLGADQFDERDPDERGKTSNFFNMFFLASIIGSTLGVTVLVWVQNNKGWDVGFGISAGATFFGIVCIMLGCSSFRNKIPEGSPLTRIVKVFVVAFKNRKLATLNNTDDLNELNDKESNLHTEKLLHTEQFIFLDKAAMLTENSTKHDSWCLCTPTEVEEAKIVVRMMPIFACTILMSTCLAQLQTFTVAQGVTMDRSMGKHFQIPAASLPVIPLIFLCIITPIYDRLFVPLARKFTGHESGITHLQRVGVGLVLSAISMAAAAVVEVKRKNVAIEKGMVDSIPLLMPPLPISVFWLGFQFFIFGISDLFTFVGMIEFFYSEAPAAMRSFATSLTYASLALGYFLSSVFVDVVNAATRNFTKSHGWLAGNNLNRNHLNLFYWLLSVLSILNFFNYLFWSRWYKHKQLVS